MRIFLLKDVAKVGRRHEVKEVADGFARNVLIPKGQALLVDCKNRARIQAIVDSEKSGKEAVGKRAVELGKKLDEVTIRLKARANEQGHLFAAIKPADVARALGEQGVTVSESELIIDPPIRAVGSHEITWHSGQSSVRFDLRVLADC